MAKEGLKTCTDIQCLVREVYNISFPCSYRNSRANYIDDNINIRFHFPHRKYSNITRKGKKLRKAMSWHVVELLTHLQRRYNKERPVLSSISNLWDKPLISDHTSCHWGEDMIWTTAGLANVSQQVHKSKYNTGMLIGHNPYWGGKDQQGNRTRCPDIPQTMQ